MKDYYKALSVKWLTIGALSSFTLSAFTIFNIELDDWTIQDKWGVVSFFLHCLDPHYFMNGI
ncbi:hypothetical protein [Modicisalibacter sp. MOD 31.J]|uniref:hypothetical protein n=1 Tax=Modicisalibacter sp. MOD 31.J TaxID=2831897 RepID=UPI001CCB60E7|nr:hypothetical protein [Modicisalibacter sp. MOD 31.J]MBZ9575084.1 hypothetical protein [Modicisalibacter sp. MOD 31.J]